MKVKRSDRRIKGKSKGQPTVTAMAEDTSLFVAKENQTFLQVTVDKHDPQEKIFTTYNSPASAEVTCRATLDHSSYERDSCVNVTEDGEDGQDVSCRQRLGIKGLTFSCGLDELVVERKDINEVHLEGKKKEGIEIRIDEGEFDDVTQVTEFGCLDKCEYEKIREKNIKEREEAMKEVLEEINETKEEMNEHASRKRKALARKEKLSQNQPLNKRVASPLEIRRAGRLRVLDENADRSGKIDQNYKFAKKTPKRNKNLKEYNLPPLPLECELFIPPIKKLRKVANNEDL